MSVAIRTSPMLRSTEDLITNLWKVRCDDGLHASFAQSAVMYAVGGIWKARNLWIFLCKPTLASKLVYLALAQTEERLGIVGDQPEALVTRVCRRIFTNAVITNKREKSEK